MALRGTLTHRKTRRLARLLNIPACYALGILEALWHLTAVRYPDGDISSLSTSDIAEELFYEGDADALVTALIESKWLDELPFGTSFKPMCTLLVHGWSENADSHIQAQLSKRRQCFADGTMPKLPHDAFNADTRARIRAEFIKKYPHLRGDDPGDGPTPPDPAPDGSGPSPDSSRTGSDKSPPYQEPVPEPVTRIEGGFTNSSADTGSKVAETSPPPLTLLTGRDLAAGVVFRPPTLDECVEEGKRWGLSESEATKFWSHYGGTGWRVRGDLLVNWQARMAGWRERQIEREAERRPTDPEAPGFTPTEILEAR